MEPYASACPACCRCFWWYRSGNNKMTRVFLLDAMRNYVCLWLLCPLLFSPSKLHRVLRMIWTIGKYFNEPVINISICLFYFLVWFWGTISKDIKLFMNLIYSPSLMFEMVSLLIIIGVTVNKEIHWFWDLAKLSGTKESPLHAGSLCTWASEKQRDLRLSDLFRTILMMWSMTGLRYAIRWVAEVVETWERKGEGSLCMRAPESYVRRPPSSGWQHWTGGAVPH